MKTAYSYKTSIGKINIVENNDKIVEIYFGEPRFQESFIIKETDLIKKTIEEIEEYLKGNRKTFNIPIFIEGTEFQRKVWDQLIKIPYGSTNSYGEIAKKINNPKAARAIGMANNRNPISIIIPCHRVIGSNGKLVGYGGGLDIKEKLLTLEKKNSSF